MKKIFALIAVAVLSISALAARPTILNDLCNHASIERITELCHSYNSLITKSETEEEASIRAIYSKYALETLQQIGAVYMKIDYPTDEMAMPLFNIGFDIVTLYNDVVRKIARGEKLTENDFYKVLVCEKGIKDNETRL